MVIAQSAQLKIVQNAQAQLQLLAQDVTTQLHWPMIQQDVTAHMDNLFFPVVDALLALLTTVKNAKMPWFHLALNADLASLSQQIQASAHVQSVQDQTHRDTAKPAN